MSNTVRALEAWGWVWLLVWLYARSSGNGVLSTRGSQGIDPKAVLQQAISVAVVTSIKKILRVCWEDARVHIGPHASSRHQSAWTHGLPSVAA